MPDEVINQWKDWVPVDPRTTQRHPSVYTADEIAALGDYHATWERTIEQTPRRLPPIVEAQALPAWAELRVAAASALRILQRRGPMPEDQEIWEGGPWARPLLLVDVDGVLNPTGTSTPPGFERRSTHAYTVTISPRHGEWLRALSERFELVWASTWGTAASEVFGSLLDLPTMAMVPLGDLPRSGTRKLAAVRSFVGERPTAWMDDEIYEDAFAWADARSEPTLLLRTSGSVGMVEADFAALLRFADSIEASR